MRSHLARFLFRGDEVDLSIKSLSGGERARLALAKLVLSEPSWLAPSIVMKPPPELIPGSTVASALARTAGISRTRLSTSR